MFEKPSYAEFCSFCAEKGWNDDWYAKELWKELERRKWKTKSGREPKNWQLFVTAINGVLLSKYKQQGVKVKNSSRRIKKSEIDCEPFSDLTNRYVCYTDGSCDNLSSTRAGGAAYIIIKDGEIVKMKNHGQIGTTNNRMELLAIISAVSSCPEGACVDVYTDSQYCILVLSKEKRPRLNADLHELYQRCSAHVEGVRFHWVKGHNGDKYNEMADDLAYGAYCDVCEEYGIKRMQRH